MNVVTHTTPLYTPTHRKSNERKKRTGSSSNNNNTTSDDGDVKGKRKSIFPISSMHSILSRSCVPKINLSVHNQL